MPFADYTEFREPLRLPYAGKLYEIPPVGLADAPRLLAAIEGTEGAELTGDEFRRMLLGSALEQMLADNVPPGFALRAEMTALSDFQGGRGAAEIMWETGGDPKALAAWAASLTPATLPSDEEAANSTQPPASTNGTSESPTPPAEAPAL